MTTLDRTATDISPVNSAQRRTSRFFIISVAILSIVFSTWLCMRMAVHTMYTGFQTYDDEGAMLITLDQLNKGHPLYDQVVTMYGPLGFLPKLALVRALHLTVNHDTGRAISLVIWVLTSIVSGATIWRITGKAIWFAAGISAVCFILSATSNEPGHPQDLCSLWIAGAIFTSTFVSRRRASVALAIIALFIGCLLLTKINLGVFCLAAAAVTLVVHLPDGVLKRSLFTVGAIAMLSIPIVLMRDSFNQRSVIYLCAEIALSLAACLVFVGIYSPPPLLHKRHIWLFGTFVTASVLIGVLITLFTGTSFRGLIEGVVLLPLRLSHSFSLRLPAEGFVVPVGAIAAISAGCVGGWFRVSRSDSRRRQRTISVIRVIVATCALVMLFTDGLLDLFLWASPLAWLLMIPVRSADDRNPYRFARVFLSFLAVTELMWAFPVAGSQVPFSLFPMAILAVIDLSDGVSGLAALAPSSGIARSIEHSVSVVVAIGILLFDAIAGNEMVSSYDKCVALHLTGAHYIHVPAQQASEFEEIAATVQRNADSLITMPGLNSFYFWTQLSPPTSANVTGWTYILTEQQQRDIVDNLIRHPNACMIFDADQLAFWQKDIGDVPRGPLTEYLMKTFIPVVTVGRYTILVRNDRETVTLPRGESLQVLQRSADGQWVPTRSY